MLDTEREAVVGNYLMTEEDVDPAELPAALARYADRRPHHLGDGGRFVDRPVSGRRASTAAAERGLEPGHVLRAFQTGRSGPRRRNGVLSAEKVRLPDEPAGTMMVFRTFERISYALVMEVTTPLACSTRFATPKPILIRAPQPAQPWRPTPG